MDYTVNSCAFVKSQMVVTSPASSSPAFRNGTFLMMLPVLAPPRTLSLLSFNYSITFPAALSGASTFNLTTSILSLLLGRNMIPGSFAVGYSPKSVPLL
jgi:hypothetical protein